MRFNAETSANDLLLAIVAKRIPEFAGFPEDDHSGGRVHPNSRMNASSKRLGKDYRDKRDAKLRVQLLGSKSHSDAVVVQVKVQRLYS